MKAYVLMACFLFLLGCRQQPEQNPVPRRVGYPRIEERQPEYQAADSLPVRMHLNTRADITLRRGHDGIVWMDAALPQYGAIVYYTFTPVTATTAPNVISNRLDRMLLNLGGIEPQIDEFPSAGGARVTLLTAMSHNSTPVQFLAAMPAFVVSGTAFMPSVGPHTPLDSIAPYIEAIRSDLIHSLSTLQPR